MYRDIILNYLSFNYQMIQNISMNKGIICLCHNEPNNELPFFDFSLYEINLPRINYKTINSDQLENYPLVDFALTLDNKNVYSKNEIDLPDDKIFGDSQYIYFYPLINNNQKVGVIILFANNLVLNFEFNKSSNTTLYKELSTSFDNDICNCCKLDVLNNDDYFYQLFHNKQIIKSNIDDKSFSSYHFVSKKDINYLAEEYNLYYCLKTKFDNKNELLDLSNIKSLDLASIFTFIFFDFEKSTNLLFKFVDELKKILNIKSKYYLLTVKNQSYVLIVESKIKKSDIIKLFNDYCLIINAPKEINNRMDLLKVINYLNDIHPIDFSMEEYLKYLSLIGNDDLFTKKGLRDKKYVYSYLNDKTGIMVNLLIESFKFMDNFIYYENNTYSSLQKIYKNDSLKDDLFVCLHTCSLKKKKITDLIKIISKTHKINVILHNDNILSIDDLKIYLYDLYTNDVSIYVDKSFYLDFNLSSLMSAVVGLYFNNNDSISIKNGGKLAKTVLNLYSDKNKLYECAQMLEINDNEFYIK